MQACLPAVRGGLLPRAPCFRDFWWAPAPLSMGRESGSSEWVPTWVQATLAEPALSTGPLAFLPVVPRARVAPPRLCTQEPTTPPVHRSFDPWAAVGGCGWSVGPRGWACIGPLQCLGAGLLEAGGCWLGAGALGVAGSGANLEVIQEF